MARSETDTVEEYLEGLSADRRDALSRVREVILESLPDGYTETVSRGQISYEVPLERYPDTYNGEPLVYASLGAQKNHFALYLMNVYGDADLKAWLEDAFEAAGLKLDMGKACLRFRNLDDLPLDVIGEVVARTPPEEFIERYEASRNR